MRHKAEHFPPGPVVHLSKVLDVIEVHGLIIVKYLHNPREALPDVFGAEGDAGVQESP